MTSQFVSAEQVRREAERANPDPLKVAVQAKSNSDGMPIVVALFSIGALVILRLLFGAVMLVPKCPKCGGRMTVDFFDLSRWVCVDEHGIGCDGSLPR
jgi:hypothetical protein